MSVLVFPLPAPAIVLDVNPEAALARLSSRGRLEAEPLLYHQRVGNPFLHIAADEPERYLSRLLIVGDNTAVGVGRCEHRGMVRVEGVVHGATPR